jgi:hypothetical protein
MGSPMGAPISPPMMRMPPMMPPVSGRNITEGHVPSGPTPMEIMMMQQQQMMMMSGKKNVYLFYHFLYFSLYHELQLVRLIDN